MVTILRLATSLILFLVIHRRASECCTAAFVQETQSYKLNRIPFRLSSYIIPVRPMFTVHTARPTRQLHSSLHETGTISSSPYLLKVKQPENSATLGPSLRRQRQRQRRRLQEHVGRLFLSSLNTMDESKPIARRIFNLMVKIFWKMWLNMTNLLTKTNKSLEKGDTITTAGEKAKITHPTSTEHSNATAILITEPKITTTTQEQKLSLTPISESKPIRHNTHSVSTKSEELKCKSKILPDVPLSPNLGETTPSFPTEDGETPTVAMVAQHHLNIIMAELERKIPAFKKVAVNDKALENVVPTVTSSVATKEKEEIEPVVEVPTTSARDIVTFIEPSTVSFAKPKPMVAENHEDVKKLISHSTSAISTIAIPKVKSTKSSTAFLEPTANTPLSPTHPIGERWAISQPTVDLTGTWNFVFTPNFKSEYDKYLSFLNQPSIVRKIAVSIVDRTIEDITQRDNGRTLEIKGTNLRGVWDRSFISSGAEPNADAMEEEIDWKLYKHLRTPIISADSEKLQSEAWWGSEGTVHHSWILGSRKYGGGDFESRRWLEDGGKTLMCKSIFHPRTKGNEKGELLWKFVRKN